MSEWLFDDTEDHTIWASPDVDGALTLRTQFKDTQKILDQNARELNETSKSFKDENGVHYHKVASVPLEVMHLLHMRIGRMPTAEELLKYSQDREFSKLRTKDVRLK